MELLRLEQLASVVSFQLISCGVIGGQEMEVLLPTIYLILQLLRFLDC